MSSHSPTKARAWSSVSLQWGHDDDVVEKIKARAWLARSSVTLQWGHDEGVVEDFADLSEHHVGNEGLGYPGADQVELPDLSQQDQGRGVEDPSDWRCHESSSSSSSSMVTWHAGTLARNKASRKSA